MITSTTDQNAGDQVTAGEKNTEQHARRESIIPDSQIGWRIYMAFGLMGKMSSYAFFLECYAFHPMHCILYRMSFDWKQKTKTCLKKKVVET